MKFNSIYEYLEYLTQEFQNEIQDMDSYCKLKDVTFKNGSLPDYNDRVQALLYCLRYHYGYAFEYEYIYREYILEAFPNETINVLSVGCGNGIDYWSLRRAVNKIYTNIKSVNYFGIDCVDWQNKIDSDPRDNVQYYNLDVKEIDKIIDAIGKIDFLFLPKSISELSCKNLSIIGERLVKNSTSICLIASFRRDISNRIYDIKKFKYLVKILESYDYTILEGNIDDFIICSNDSIGIRSIYTDYIYPDDTFDLISTLYESCNSKTDTKFKCLISCQDTLSRRPILTTNQVCFNYVIMKKS